MAKISEYNVLFQDVHIQSERRPNALNVTESKTNHKRPPFFLPKLKANETSSKADKHQQLDMQLDVRGLGRNTGITSFGKRTKRNVKRTRKPKNRMNGLSSPNKITDQKRLEFSLPPIDSKSLTQQHMENILSCSNAGTLKPYREFEIALNTLMKVIDRSKEEQKRTMERFQRDIVHGEQKPISEKLQTPEETKSDCLPVSPE